MAGYHVSVGEDGLEKSRPCGAATIENCPFSKNDGAAHGATAAEAWEAHEKQLTEEAGGSFGKLNKKGKKNKASAESEAADDNDSGGFDIFASLARIQSESADVDEEENVDDDDIDDNQPSGEADIDKGNNDIFGGEYKGYDGADLFSETNERVFADQAVGVYATKNEGMLTANGAFNAHTIRGTIDHNRLQKGDDSRVFGFAEIRRYQPYLLKEFNTEDEYSYSDMTDAEYDQLTKQEKQVMNAFTGNDFLWINDKIYANKSGNTEQEEGFGHVTSTMDRAISKGPKKQRFLYRAVKGNDPLFNEDGEAMTANEWLSAGDGSRIGTEVSFSGYQSTSDKTDGVKKFSRDDGVMVEILSPEGVSVATNSEYQDEYEVVLPRNQRYMVVGTHKHVDIDFPQTHHTAYRDTADNMTVVRLVAINSKGEILDGQNHDDIKPLS